MHWRRKRSIFIVHENEFRNSTIEIPESAQKMLPQLRKTPESENLDFERENNSNEKEDQEIKESKIKEEKIKHKNEEIKFENQNSKYEEVKIKDKPQQIVIGKGIIIALKFRRWKFKQ